VQHVISLCPRCHEAAHARRRQLPSTS
jgi:predicted HNH restriction endonuclease